MSGRNININLGDVTGWESLPEGSYLGDIKAIIYQEAQEAGKYAQLKVTYTSANDDETAGKDQSQWLSLSPKALGRLKKWFTKFGLGDVAITDDSFNDETDELMEPDLTGYRVIFTVFRDPKPYKGEIQLRTDLVSVEEDADGNPIDGSRPPTPVAPTRRAPAPAPTRAPRRAPPEPEPEEEAEEAAPMTAKERKRAELAAQIAALEEEDDGDEEEEAEEAPAPPTRRAPKPARAPAVAARPQRRTLR